MLVGETVAKVEEELERWRAVIEDKGLRISRSKTEYLVPSHQQGVVKLEGEPLPSVNSFKYLGSVIDGSGGCGKDVDGRIKVAWSKCNNSSFNDVNRHIAIATSTMSKLSSLWI